MTFNEDFFDASLRHQIDLLRFGSGVAKRVNSLLDATRADLRKQVERRLGKVTGITGASLRRLRELERGVVAARSPAWNDVAEAWERTAIDVALDEPVRVAGQLTSLLPVELDLVQPSDATLRALVTTRPFQGRFLKEWAESTQRADLTRIHQQIRIGMVQGESARDIANRVFGDRGAMNVTRHQVEAVTRTVINHVSNAAQQEFLRQNSDLFSVEQLVATLDARTTPVCRAEDGKQYPIGKGPIPPLHVACRSIRVGVLDGEVIGERPFKAGTEQQMLREYSEARGLGRVRSRADLPRGSKGDFDAFSRRRMRELTGQVPAKTTYQEWLSKQPAAIQDDILGPIRGKLFRDGGLKLDRFVNRQGDELTLEELRRRNREAWERAGLGATGKERREPLPPAPPPAPAPPQVRPIQELVGSLEVDPRVPDETRSVVERAMRQANLPRLPQLLIYDRLPDSRSNGDYAAWSGQLRVAATRPVEGAALPDVPGKGKIWSISATGKTRPEAVRLTTLHELGHHAHMWGVARFEHFGAVASFGQRTAGAKVDEIVNRVWNDPNREYLTDYAGVSLATPERYRSSEYFAEAHAAYHAYPDWLRRVAPKAYAAVEEVLRIRREADL